MDKALVVNNKSLSWHRLEGNTSRDLDELLKFLGEPASMRVNSVVGHLINELRNYDSMMLGLGKDTEGQKRVIRLRVGDYVVKDDHSKDYYLVLDRDNFLAFTKLLGLAD